MRQGGHYGKFPDVDWRSITHELATVLPNLARLVGRLAKDARVPRRAKLIAAAAAVYALSPLDLVPDFIPVVGRADDLVILVLAAEYVIDEAGLALVREHWDGADATLSLMLDAVGMAAGVVPGPVRVAIHRYLRG